ncbi:phosphorylase family protein [Methylobacter psychrophilus]|uniref:phosphorylase family protein n=1 Tax=Methylobacter psychrophilus TaxID=96941 RepID=UPI0021D510B7|nr:phosphorylase [Methylobacter psychrophilus]
MITGIVVALPEELATLTSKKISKGHCLFIADKLLVAYSGTGPINAGLAAELLAAKGAGRLISWGCAAALSASLKPGDLILADKLIDAGNCEMAVNTDWHSEIKNRLAKFMVIHSGALVESISIVSSSTDKKQLHSITGAVALDMESIAIAKVASQHALPFITIRAIVDPVIMNLPLAINYSLNNSGDIMLGKLLLFLLLHPAELPGLIKLGLHFNAAKKTLKLVASYMGTIAHN